MKKIEDNKRIDKIMKVANLKTVEEE